MPGGTGTEYKGTFALADGAGQLITTYDKLNPPRGQPKAGNPNGRVFLGVVSPWRKLSAVNVTSDIAITQTLSVCIRDRDGVARIIVSSALTAATQASYVPAHEIWIGPKENFQVDLTNSGTPAASGTITIFTEEN